MNRDHQGTTARADMTDSDQSTTESQSLAGDTRGTDSGSNAGGTPEPALAKQGRPMLGEFCDAFERSLRPLLEPLKSTTEELTSVPDDVPARAILPALRDLADQFSVLVNKVAEQQAYVLIFGPLKSGKSTFMNAICAKYVSEVSALPAYPCLVQVSHANEPRYVVTRYNGGNETFTNQDRLRGAVESDHRRLMETIRRCEEQGTEFEPQRHAPDAIRRIDVRLPAGDLAQTSAVLVDTPGLYSRMKFGYDRMTREFRNAAACAIFVVKTDNLFLDQVFDEFNELLELFSRIFLIVNLDAAKQDLKPDGSLAPSLEHEDPQAVVQAFESLSMGAPLKRARAEGRLRIYPVDLLGAASRRIRAGHAGEGKGAIEDEPRGQADFDELLKDLMDYLNSNEYLRAFLGDSLRRADSLLGELSQLVSDPGVGQLENEVHALTDERETLSERSEATRRLAAVDWGQRLAGQSESLREALSGQAEPIKRAARNALHGALDAWFENDDSLEAVLEQDVQPSLERCRDDLIRLVREALEARAAQPQGGLALTPEARRDLETLDIDLGEAAKLTAAQLDLGALLAVPDARLRTERIPVRRGILDWLLLRTRNAVRKRLFGPPEKPDKPIPSRVKAKRLGSAARDAMRGLLDEALDGLAARAQDELPRAVVDAYTAAFTERMTQRLEEARAAARDRLDAVEARLGELRKAHERLAALRANRSQAAEALVRLEKRFGDAGRPAPRTPADAVTEEVEPAEP